MGPTEEQAPTLEAIEQLSPTEEQAPPLEATEQLSPIVEKAPPLEAIEKLCLGQKALARIIPEAKEI